MSLEKIYRHASFLTGILVTIPIVSIPIGGRAISAFALAFTLFLLLTALYALASGKAIKPNIYIIMFGVWLTLCLSGSLFGLTYFSGEPEWQAAVIAYIPKLLLFFLLFSFICFLKTPSITGEYILNGMLLGFILNMIWATLEGLMFYTKGIALNDIVFYRYAEHLPENRPTLTIVADGIIRASGFNYDPAHMGGIIPIALLYSILRKKILLFWLSLVALAFSGSTTAVVSSLGAIALTVGKLRLLQLTRINWRSLLAGNLVFAFLAFGVVLNKPAAIDGLYDNIYGFYNRVNTYYIKSADQGPRAIYHSYLPEAMQAAGASLLTGTGLGTGSFPYVSDSEIIERLSVEKYPYDPESTYISYLFDIGVFGLTAYIVILILCFFYYRKKIGSSPSYDLIYAGLCGILLSGFFYHYILTAYHMLILIFAVALTRDSGRPTASNY